MRSWEARKTLFNRMKTASSKFRPAKRESIKARWWKWSDRQAWSK